MSQANVPAQQIQDPLVNFQIEIQQERDRLRRFAKDKLAPDDPRQQIYTEMDGTLLSIQVDTANHLLYLRDWFYSRLQEGLAALDDRIERLEVEAEGEEEAETQFTAEDASDFQDLCDGAELLAKESTWKGKKEKEEFLAKIAKCRQTIEDGLLVDEPEDEEGDEDEEEGAAAGQVETIGGDEAQS